MSHRERLDPNAILESALNILESGLVTIDELRRANEWRQCQRPQLGQLALSHGKLAMNQVFAILKEQAVTGKMFGETAVAMGLLQDDLYELLKKQAESTPTLAESLVSLGILSSEQATLVLFKPTTKSALPCSDPLHIEPDCDKHELK